MDKTLGERFLGRDSALLDVRYYCCPYVVYVVHAAYMMSCACSVVYTWHVYLLFMQCHVQDGTYSVV